MNKKLKGFTLMELIVVMAIFGIIMAAAMQILPLVTKMMVQADVHEGGNAAATGVSNYIKGELQGAEYVTVYNKVPADFDADGNYVVNTTVLNDWVQDFANDHYKAIIQNESVENDETALAAFNLDANCATGNIHVMLVDNTSYDKTDISGNVLQTYYGMVRSGTYAYKFGTTPSCTTAPSAFDIAVNRAYYESYPMQIKFGGFDTVADFNAAGTEDYAALAEAIKPENTRYTIMTTVERNHTDFSFLTNVSTTMMNIMHNHELFSGSIPEKTYYTVFEDSTGVKKIVDVATLSDYKTALQYEVADDSSCPHPYSGGHAGYCFIYSYTSEINH
ncbi:MAG: prepilin-type N-terminal cleavage/methylation domain-containing protein [Ruminococcus sp.]|nr:prepilin-type N-terminal cleavage/methylation domain-containing protein [Ruminococcus sp.]